MHRRSPAALSRELGAHGICVNTLAPGYTLSDTWPRPTPAMWSSPSAAAIQRRALKRDEYPEDLLGTLVFLCSADSDFITGQVTTGGWRGQQQRLIFGGSTAVGLVNLRQAPQIANTARLGARYQFIAKSLCLGRNHPRFRGQEFRKEDRMSVATVDPKHNVTGNRQAYYDKITKKRHGAAVGGAAATSSPRSRSRKCSANVWKFDDVKRLMLEAGDVITAEEAERRVLVLENPALRGQSRVTNTLFAGIQLILPGESRRGAPARLVGDPLRAGRRGRLHGGRGREGQHVARRLHHHRRTGRRTTTAIPARSR